MSSREKILAAVHSSQPPLVDLIELDSLKANVNEVSERSRSALPGMSTGSVQDVPEDPLVDAGLPQNMFSRKLQAIGGHCKIASGMVDIIESLKHQFPGDKRFVSTFPNLKSLAEVYVQGDKISAVEEVDVAIIGAHFAVAENGAVWITEDQMIDRVLPFVSQHLVVIVSWDDVCSTMHDAYERIGDADYGYAAFIAGPSKTADIEQSLVLGAHGPVSMTVFLLRHLSAAGA